LTHIEGEPRSWRKEPYDWLADALSFLPFFKEEWQTDFGKKKEKFQIGRENDSKEVMLLPLQQEATVLAETAKRIREFNACWGRK